MAGELERLQRSLELVNPQTGIRWEDISRLLAVAKQMAEVSKPVSEAITLLEGFPYRLHEAVGWLAFKGTDVGIDLAELRAVRAALAAWRELGEMK